jgi:hypothetical protein
MGHFSVTILTSTGSVLSDSQQGCLKLELRGHLVLVQFHSGRDAADAHVGTVVVVSP